MIDYGSRIKKYRDQKGFSQDFMAEQLGISQNAFHKIETGQTKLKANTLQQIADILEIDILKLLNHDAEKFKIKQSSHDTSTGVAFYNENFDEERRVWQLLENSMKEIIEAQKMTIESLKEVTQLQKELLSK